MIKLTSFLSIVKIKSNELSLFVASHSYLSPAFILRRHISTSIVKSSFVSGSTRLFTRFISFTSITDKRLWELYFFDFTNYYSAANAYRIMKMDSFARIKFYRKFLKKYEYMKRNVFEDLNKFENDSNKSLLLFSEDPKLKKQLKGHLNKFKNEFPNLINFTTKQIEQIFMLYEDYEIHIVKYQVYKNLLSPPLIDGIDLVNLLEKNVNVLGKIRGTLLLVSEDSAHFQLSDPSLLSEITKGIIKLTFTKMARLIALIISFKNENEKVK